MPTGRVGPAVLVLATLTAGVATAQAETSGGADAAPRTIQQLISDLASSDTEVRATAAWQLASARELLFETRAALRPLRSDQDRRVRYAASWALAQLRFRGANWMHQETLASAPYDTPPRPTRMMAARYPEAALRAHVEGVVEVEILVGEEGEVAYVEVRRSIPLLDEAALACVRKWRFSPALRGGKATAATASAPVFFTIPKDSTR